jgi:hypothetical protein
MSTKYAKALEETRKYQAYVESLKPRFGLWDDCDPVARAILGLVETQNSLAAAIDDDPYVEEDGEPRHADIPKALEFRIKAALSCWKCCWSILKHGSRSCGKSGRWSRTSVPTKYSHAIALGSFCGNFPECDGDSSRRACAKPL